MPEVEKASIHAAIDLKKILVIFLCKVVGHEYLVLAQLI